MSEFGLGYRRDVENFAQLEATETPFVLPQTYAAPESISHRAWRKAKNQGRVGSCSGFSRASGEEVLNYIATGGSTLHFSEMYAYLCNQQESGGNLFGSDQGATIWGSCQASQKDGICLSDTFPYPGVYTTQIPEAAFEEGKRHLIQTHAVMKSYDDCLKWISSGVGVVLIGIPWTSGMKNAGPRIKRGQERGSLFGGHALVLHGYDKDGWLDMENSHGPGWGDNGFAYIDPALIDSWIQSGEAFIGISDLQSYGPRPVPTYAGSYT